MELRDALHAELEGAFLLDSGPEKEREINRLAISLIRLLVADIEPTVSEVWLDWDRDGLLVTAVRDWSGEPIAGPDGMDEALQLYSSNIRDTRLASDLHAPRGIHGPFVLKI